jgi:hypothetical protein
VLPTHSRCGWVNNLLICAKSGVPMRMRGVAVR